MYQQTKTDSGVVRVIDGAFIPPDLSNRDYAAYLEWVAQGNVPEPFEPPFVDPAEAARAEIEALETKHLMARITRETILTLAEERAAALGIPLEVLLVKNKGYAALKALDVQIAELRAQL